MQGGTSYSPDKQADNRLSLDKQSETIYQINRWETGEGVS